MVLMFTDLVNSTALKEQIGKEAYARLLHRHDEFIRQALAIAPSGRVLQDTGDGYFISFDSVAHAVYVANFGYNPPASVSKFAGDIFTPSSATPPGTFIAMP